MCRCPPNAPSASCIASSRRSRRARPRWPSPARPTASPPTVFARRSASCRRVSPSSARTATCWKSRRRTMLTLPETWIKGTLKCQVQVYPSTLADLQKGLESLLREPSGCFEQTSTSNYPNLLILQYLKESDQTKPAVERRARRTARPRLSEVDLVRVSEPGAAQEGRLRVVRRHGPGPRGADGLRPDGVPRHGPRPRGRSGHAEADAAISAPVSATARAASNAIRAPSTPSAALRSTSPTPTSSGR